MAERRSERVSDESDLIAKMQALLVTAGVARIAFG